MTVEFGKNLQRHSEKINWLYGTYNKECYRFYFSLFWNYVLHVLTFIPPPPLYSRPLIDTEITNTMNPDGGKIHEGIKAEWCAGDCPGVGESSWLKAASHVKIGGMPFWKDKFKDREGGKNLCAAIIVNRICTWDPNMRSPHTPFFSILCLGATQGHCPFGPWKCLWLLASSMDPQRCVSVQFSSVQSLSRVRLFVTPWTTAHQTSLSITNSWSLLKLMSVESVMPSNHLILCQSFLLPPSILPSIRVFSNESVLRIRWPKYWSFSFSISPSNEYSGLISFRMDWLHLLAVQGTLKSPPTPQFKSINSSALSFLYSPTLTSIHDYWKNHSFD